MFVCVYISRAVQSAKIKFNSIDVYDTRDRGEKFVRNFNLVLLSRLDLVYVFDWKMCLAPILTRKNKKIEKHKVAHTLFDQVKNSQQ